MRAIPTLVAGALACAAATLPALPAGAQGPPSSAAPAASLHADHSDVSPALRSMGPARNRPGRFVRDNPQPPVTASASGPDGAMQSTATATAAPSTGSTQEGIGQGFKGPQGTFSVQYAPPDTNGDVSASNYVEVVNTDFAIWNKSGSSLGTVAYGPVPTNTLWSGFGGACASNNDGDATVRYDRSEDRWVMQQFSVSTTPYLDCVAVSQTGDPTGKWYRFALSGFGSYMPDYPKIGIWPDGYYLTFNRFYRARTFAGAGACVLPRESMLTGSFPSAPCFTTSTSYSSLLPADVDGATAPGAGENEYLLSLGSNQLQLWRFHADWNNTANDSLTGPTPLAVASFSLACGGGACVPQQGTSQQLDSLGDRLMYRLSYRNFGDHEALVVSHSVTAGSATGVRWYELRSPSGGSAWSVFQQGTYAPDGSYRWMPSAAMDGSGDIAVGYSVSSASMHPALRFSGRTPTDQLGTLETETSLIEGSGSQTTNLDRWGDYASMSVDPTDDCTFWFAGEYLKTNGTWNWSTRIGSFKFPNCGSSSNSSGTLSFGTPAPQLTAGTAAAMSVQLSSAQHSTMSVDLTTTSANGGFSTSSSGTFTSSLSLPVSANATSATFYYRDTTAGSPTLTAAATGWTSGTQTENVAAAALSAISVSPSSVTLAEGAQQQLTATGRDPYNNPVQVTPTWSDGGLGGNFSPSSGAVTTYTAGNTTTTSGHITATQGSVTGTATLTVTQPTANGTMNVALVPQPSTSHGRNYQTPIQLTASDAGSSTGIGGASVSWTVFSGSCATGQAIANGTGSTASSGQLTFSFTAKTGTFCASATVTSPNYNDGNGATSPFAVPVN